MANPQLEKGHIDIANEIAEALAGYRLSGEEWQILWVIIRKTWGWHKKEDMISLSQFSLLTKLLKPCISRSIKKLLAKRLITISKSANPMLPNTYGFNKHYDQWTPLAKRIITVSQIDKTTFSQNATHKRKRTTKEKEYVIPYKEIVEIYHELCPRMPRVHKLTDKRRDKIKSRWAELKTLDEFRRLFELAGQSDFLCGVNGRKWSADLLWILDSEEHVVKILEGGYKSNFKTIEKPVEKPVDENWYKEHGYDLIGGSK